MFGVGPQRNRALHCPPHGRTEVDIYRIISLETHLHATTQYLQHVQDAWPCGDEEEPLERVQRDAFAG